MPDARAVEIRDRDDVVHGDLTVPKDATGLVAFAHGSGSRRHSPRNRTGAAAALVAATARPDEVRTVVSRGGRPDMAGDALAKVRCPTLLIVGGRDRQVIDLNERARDRMPAEVRLELVPGATHLFEEDGALDRVVGLARAWLVDRLRPAAPGRA